MVRHSRSLWLVAAALTVGTGIGMVVAPQMPRALAADIDQEKIVYLRELEPIKQDYGIPLRTAEHTVIAGRIWNDPVLLHQGGTPEEVMWDTGGTFDLFEAHVGISDLGDRGTATLVFIGDGERLGALTLKHGDQARFFSCPMNRCRAFTIRVVDDETRRVVLLDARLVRGRTTPSQPHDIIIDDGEIKYIERPGEYRFHFRKAD